MKLYVDYLSYDMPEKYIQTTSTKSTSAAVAIKLKVTIATRPRQPLTLPVAMLPTCIRAYCT